MTMTTTATQILDAASQRPCVHYGIRVVDEPREAITIGSTLAPSRIWVDNEPTGELLDGTSALLLCSDRDATLDDVTRALDAADAYGESTSTILLLGSDYCGMDSAVDAGEILLRNPRVLGAWSR